MIRYFPNGPFKVFINGNDVSSWVVRSDDIPITDRNRDYTPVASAITMQIDLQCPYEYGRDSSLDVYYNSRIVWKGYITDSEFTYATGAVEYRTITIRSVLGKLEQYTVTYDNLHSRISNTDDPLKYKVDSVFETPHVKLTWLIDRMFEKAGVTISHRLDEVLPGNYIEEKDIVKGDTFTEKFYIDDVYIDENMLYAMNQDFAAHHSVYEQNPDWTNKFLTFFDLFSEICSAFSINVVHDDGGLLLFASSPSLFYPDDSDVLGRISYGDKEGEYGGWGASVMHNRDRENYVATAVFYKPETAVLAEFDDAWREENNVADTYSLKPISRPKIGDGKGAANAYSNLIFLYRNKTNPDEEGDLWLMNDGIGFDYDEPPDGRVSFSIALKNKGDALGNYFFKEATVRYDGGTVYPTCKSQSISITGDLAITVRQEIPN